MNSPAMQSKPYKKPTPLQLLNWKRFQDTGTLLRVAALLESLQRRYPNLKVSNDIDGAIGIIQYEVEMLNSEYRVQRAIILSKRITKELLT